MKILYIIAVFCFIVSGCKTNNEPMPTEEGYIVFLDNIKGISEEDAINKFGVPTSHYELKNKKYLVYDRTVSFMLPGSSPRYFTSPQGYSTPIGGSSPMMINMSCKTTLILEKGIVVDWQYQGNACKA